MIKLDPRISEFDATEAAESYDQWFRAKVEAVLANPQPTIPHDQVIARARAAIQAAPKRQKLA